MGDGLNADETKISKMGASSNPNSARLSYLQERKKVLEETIAKRNQELRELCLKEAELTGVTPSETPTEPTNHETVPNSATKVGARYQLPPNLITNMNNDDESLEIQIQLHFNMAEAALRLANDSNLNKTIRKQHYEHYKQQYMLLQQKRDQANQLLLQTQLKPKKKPRGPEQEDAVSVNINMNDHNFGNSTLRHSMRSLQHPLKTVETNEHRFLSQPKLTYRKSDDNLFIENTHLKQDDGLLTSFHKLNLHKYDHHESSDSSSTHQYPNSSPHNYPSQPHQSPHFYPKTPMTLQSSPSGSFYQDYYSKGLNTPPQIHKNLSNTVPKNQKLYSYQNQYYSTLGNYDQQHPYNNPLQIQPHQQYEHDVMPSGLGGYWKRKENGELIWCHNSSFDNVWQRDKRCGSLDRRKNKRLHKRISPNVDPKSATLASVPIHSEATRPAMIPIAQQNTYRNRQDNCQLVRTQSLGSVGVHTLDSVYPSDDNSSCGSEIYNYDNSTIARKQKQKEWYETSLDDVPVVPSTPKPTRSLSTIPSIMPDVKYTELTPHVNYISTTPTTTKNILEIPAESNPSPKVPEANLELFNNNIPKNCTVVLAGHVKPYHEETKPFEMSDFYKYSTKFKNAAGDKNLNSPNIAVSPCSSSHGGYMDDGVKNVTQKGIYQPLQPMKCQPYNPLSNSNMSHQMSPVSMNHNIGSPVEPYSHINSNWYRGEDQPDNGSERSRSTATLV
ncbi:uncharacterized protein [Onthophagus taurus]|uniref:uncharacterized protein n=1 Tax=Onthophagus taurus TaxID=166361 RepID=UPI000C20F5B8|nr:uncharacterized protein LOC111413890 [Onthophagus taurus]XP_022900789.1 uncharacterized protein LOC111413890 [Onthophagus taurus]